MYTDEDRVLSLSRREVSVIYLTCQDKTLKEIAIQIGRSVKLVSHYRTKAYKKLELSDFPDEDKITYLKRLYCPILSQYIKSPKDIENWIPKDPNTGKALLIVDVKKIEDQEDEEERELGLVPYEKPEVIPYKEVEKVIEPTEKKEGEKPPPPYLLYALLALAAVTIVYLLTRNPSTPELIVQTVVHTATSPPESTPLAPATIEPSLETTPADFVAIQTDAPAPTEAPTPTLAPTPTILPLGFEDPFADGLSEEWEILSGEPLILDQAYLIPKGDDLFIAYGDPRWTNYEIEVGVEAAECGTLGNYIAVRMTEAHYLAFVFSGCGGSFWEFTGVDRVRLEGTLYSNEGLKGTTVRLVVKDNQVVGYTHGIAVKSITTTFPEGRVGLKIRKGTRITFFRVKELQP